MSLRNLVAGDWERTYLERFGRPWHYYPGVRCDDLACGCFIPRRFRGGTVGQALHGLASHYRRNKTIRAGNGLCRSNFFTLHYKTRRDRLFDRLMGSHNGRIAPRSFDSEIRLPARIVDGG